MPKGGWPMTADRGSLLARADRAAAEIDEALFFGGLTERLFPTDPEADAMAEMWAVLHNAEGGIGGPGVDPDDVRSWFEWTRGSPGHADPAECGRVERDWWRRRVALTEAELKAAAERADALDEMTRLGVH